MAIRHSAALLLFFIPVTSSAGDWYATIGASVAYQETYFEGESDDAIEDCCAYVSSKREPDSLHTTGDSYAEGGRFAIGYDTDHGVFEFGWAYLGTWQMEIDNGNAATGERRISALYGMGIWPVARVFDVPVSVAFGVHRANVQVRTRDQLSGDPAGDRQSIPKLKIDENGYGFIAGVRVGLNEHTFLSIEKWEGMGYEHTTGVANPVVMAINYRF